MAMQTEPHRPPTTGGYFGDAECSPLTVGGNSCVTNGNEYAPLDRVVEATTTVVAPQADGFHPAGG